MTEHSFIKSGFILHLCAAQPALKSNSPQNATKASFVIEYESNLRVNAELWRKRHFQRFTVVSFSGTLILNGAALGRDTMASKSVFLKQQEVSTQHETLLVAC